MGWRRLLVGLLGAVVVTACGGNGGQAGKVSLTPSPGPSATPCQTAECYRTNYHRQDLTFSGALNGHVDRARVANCESNPSGGFVLVLEQLPVTTGMTSLRIDIGMAYHGAGSYKYGGDPNSDEGAFGAVIDPHSTATKPIRYLMNDGTVTLDPGAASGSIEADFALQTETSKVVHLSGRWSCVSPRP